MKKILTLPLLLILFIIVPSCSKEDNFSTDVGQLNVTLSLPDSIATDTTDFSEYGIALIPLSGQTIWIYSSQLKDITWPIEVRVGKYNVAAASPEVSRTDSTVTYYYAEKEALIVKDQITEVNLQFELRDYPLDE